MSGLPAASVTVVTAEGRRVMRLRDELPPALFGAVLAEYQRLLRRVLEEAGGRSVEIAGDTATAVYATAALGARAAAAAHRAVAAHAWPHGQALAISVGVDSGPDAAASRRRCEELCDAAEGGQTLLSTAAADALRGHDLGDLRLRDVGDRRTRRGGRSVRAVELVALAADEPA